MPYTPGPFDSRHFYLQWGGKLPGNEQWSCGLRFATTGGAVAVNTPVDAGQVAAVTAYHTSISTAISSRAKLSFVKINVIGTDGHYVDDSTREAVVADVGGGGLDTSSMPNQVALAVSLTTGFSRGPAHRGRFYLPMPTFSIDANGVIAAANAAAVGTATDTFLAAMTATFGIAVIPAVFSRKSGAPGHRAITGNEVGRVYDTQRRRRRSLAEDYR